MNARVMGGSGGPGRSTDLAVCTHHVPASIHRNAASLVQLTG